MYNNKVRTKSLQIFIFILPNQIVCKHNFVLHINNIHSNHSNRLKKVLFRDREHLIHNEFCSVNSELS